MDNSTICAQTRRSGLMHISAAAAASLGSVDLSAGAQPCQWEVLEGGGFNSKVFALAPFGQEGKPDLYAGGTFRESLGSPANRIARWSGGEWHPVGSGVAGVVLSLRRLDDGRGPALFAGGTFGRAGVIPDANGIARWDAQEWSALGTGLYNEDPGHTHAAWDTAVFDDGSGPALYVGGHFTEAGGVPAVNIARWDGDRWSALGDGLEGTPGVRALAAFDDGSGPALYAGGYIVGGILRWNGASWETTPALTNAHAFAVFDDGSGPALYVGGQWGGGLNRWDGERWSVVGGGTNFSVNALHVFDDGTGPALFVGGAFLEAGGKQAWGIAKWDGKEWHDLDGGIYDPSFFSVDAMTTFDDGSGPALYVAGKFTFAGGPSGIPVQNIARWRCSGGCYPDCDGDGSLDFFDFLCFQNLFAAMDPEADCDGSGGLDFFDFLCFQNDFARGCP